MYEKRVNDLFVMMNNMMKKETELDSKCSDLSRLCRMLLDAVRDVMKHDADDYSVRKAKKEDMMEIFAYLQADDLKVIEKHEFDANLGEVVGKGH